jgi:hypothetical protein
MSVITECRPGDRFLCVQEFHACPDGDVISWDTRRRFRVGELLRFVGHRRNESLKDHSESHLVVFDAQDGKRYAATQTYFLTEDCWKGVARHLARQINRRKAPHNGSPMVRKKRSSKAR